MKRIIFSVFFLFIFLTSCSHGKYGALDYQKNITKANCIVDGTYELNILISENTKCVEVISPENISGIKFEFDETQANIVYHDIKIPIQKKYLRGIDSLCNMFSLDENNAVPSENKNALAFDMNGTIYTLYFNEDFLPKHIDIASPEFEYSIDIKSIEQK